MAELLESLGCAVQAARGVDEALLLFDSLMPDMVLCDVRMLPRDGYELLYQVRQVAPNIPVVLMSTNWPMDARERALRAGAAEFLAMPFTQDEFFGALKASIGDP